MPQPRSLGDVARARLARGGATPANNPWKPKRDPGLRIGASRNQRMYVDSARSFKEVHTGAGEGRPVEFSS